MNLIILRLALFSLFISLLLGCHNSVSKKENKIEGWTSLKITLENYKVIELKNSGASDSAAVTTYLKGSIFQPIKKVQIIKEKLFFTQAEKDTICDLASDIISHPTAPKHFCTEFVGDIQLAVSYGDQLTRSCTYESVCDWTTLSDKTLKLNAILTRRMKHR